MTTARPGPERLPVGSVDPTQPGQPWWRYRPMEVPRGRDGTATPTGDGGDAPETTTPVVEDAGEQVRRANLIQSTTSSGAAATFVGAAILASVGVATQLGATREGPWLVPLGAIVLTVGVAQFLMRRHPDEPWLGRLLILGTVVKLLAAYARYFNLETNYNGQGDASDYDRYGRGFANAWLHGGPVPFLPDERKTNFVRHFTGYVYYIFGPNLMTGTFVYALLALVGTYFWYRATADAVPIVNKRLYLILVLFAPSVAFWPAIVGKEALMQLGIGSLALGASMMFRQKLIRGLLVALPGGWLTWTVRPHLLALVTIAAAVAYFAGRVGAKGFGLLSRPAGIIIMAFIVAFTVGQAAKFLGINSLSASSIQSELDQTTAQTSEGGSHFSHGSNSLNPIYLPSDAATVFVRPFPYEAHGLQLLASAEGVALMALLVMRFKSVRLSLRRSREMPFLMFAWVLVGLYSIAFASFANFGILVRQRSLVLPAILVVIAVDPALDRLRHGDGTPEPSGKAVAT